MNTAGYLILIAALLIVAGLLLYARFVSRARENSLHHTPGDPVPAAEAPTVSAAAHESVGMDESVAEDLPVRGEIDGEKGVASHWQESTDPENGQESPVVDAAEGKQRESEETIAAGEETRETPEPVGEPAGEVLALRRHDSGKEGQDVDEERKGEYLDELQEAAAGLAMLMRSSPVSNRSNPVVFAPDDSDGQPLLDQDSERRDASEERVLMKVSLPEPGGIEEEEAVDPPLEAERFEAHAEAEEVESPDNRAADADPIAVVAEEGDAVDPVDETSVLEKEDNILRLLGPGVSEQFAEIDSGLDLLEDLVDGIEASLRNLALEGEDVEPTLDGEVVGQAA